MLHQELTFTTNRTYILLRTNTQIHIWIEEEFELIAKVSKILVVRCSGKQQHLAIHGLDEVFNIMITRSL